MEKKHIKEITFDQPVDTGRRKAVKKIIGSVTALAAYNMLPASWERPVIEQVFLPAHAQTSGIRYSLSDPCSLTLLSGNQNMPEAQVLVEGFVTPATTGLPVTITALPEGGSGGAVTVTTATDGEGKFSSSVTVTGGPGMTRINVQTQVEGSTNEAGCALDLGVRGGGPSCIDVLFEHDAQYRDEIIVVGEPCPGGSPEDALTLIGYGESDTLTLTNGAVVNAIINPGNLVRVDVYYDNPGDVDTYYIGSSGNISFSLNDARRVVFTSHNV